MGTMIATLIDYVISALLLLSTPKIEQIHIVTANTNDKLKHFKNGFTDVKLVS